MSDIPVHAVILAGSRPGVDPFAAAFGASFKSLIPVRQKPMLSYPASLLAANDHIASVRILTQETAPLKNALDAAVADKCRFVESSATIAASMENLLDGEDAVYPLLITTADNVLLDADMVTYFSAQAAGADIGIAVVEKETLLARYPRSKRTWLKFRGGYYSGANLFYFGSSKARSILRYWAEVEQDRKKGWKILSIFGPWLLFLVLTRMISIDQLATRVGKKLGLNVTIVRMPQAEACIDVDKEADLILAEEILASRAD